jgi:ADP-ribosylglycohydrolase
MDRRHSCRQECRRYIQIDHYEGTVGVVSMLLELAIGDAYGAGFEYAADQVVRAKNDLSAYIQHPRHGIRPGCYTDDTQMSVAIAEAIVSDDPWIPEVLAQRFVAAFQRDPREGYAGGFYAFLQEVRDGAEFLARIRPDSDKSGAAMRAGPIGVYRPITEVIRRCTIQAGLTHNTPDGISAAVAAALMTHYFIYHLGPKSDLGAFLAAHVPGPWTTPWRGKVGAKGLMSVHAAASALMANSSMSSLLRACVAFTGDVDTVATIALAAGACSQEVAQDLPENFVSGLEHGRFGRDFLRELDRRLMARVVAPGPAADRQSD